MKRLDLSCLPLNLEVGETMELIDKDGKYHLLQCVKSKDHSVCDGCFFAGVKVPFSCDYVMCSSLERKEDVIYTELPVKNEFEEEESEMKTLTVDTLTETDKIKSGETFIYIDGFNKKHKVVAKPLGILSEEEACKRCVFKNDNCCRVSCTNWDRKRKDDVYYLELT